MAEPESVTSRIYVLLEGAPLESTVAARIVEVVVEGNAHLPGMFEIHLNDEFREGELALLDKGPFELAKTVEIKAPREDGQEFTLIKGEITGLEPDYGEGMVVRLVVRGYDKSHRLFRERKSNTYLNQKDSDLASQIARNVGLSAQVETTTTTYEHIFQHAQTDLEFLMERAWRIGFECFVQDGALIFRKPPQGAAATTLNWGEDLWTFRPRVTLAEQVDEVIVKGWDVDQMKEIVGSAGSGQLYPKIGESKNGAAWAHSFGVGKEIIVDLPVKDQAEATKLAQARLNELSGSFVAADGAARRRPDLKAGTIVKLDKLGQRLSGDYLLTSVSHRWTNEQGLVTDFTVSGTRTGLLSERLGGEAPHDRLLGVYPAVVTNADDPQKWGRVKVKFPWLDTQHESTWARVLGPGAGPERGLFCLPDVDDEVVVAFEHGDIGRPFVLGGVWNGRHQIPPDPAGAASNEMPKVRVWHSHTGHKIAMFDDSKNKVEVVTKGGHQITLDDAGKKLEVKSSGGLVLTMDDNSRKITIKGGGDINIEAMANMNFKATGNMSLEATGSTTLKGTTVTVQGSGITEVKGGVVKIN